MKNICFLIGDINHSGGTERVTTLIANALDENENKIFVLSLSNGDKPFFESLMPDPKLNTESFSFKTKETVTLEEINEKLDRLLMLNNVISSTLYTGREVVEAFKKLHGVK